ARRQSTSSRRSAGVLAGWPGGVSPPRGTEAATASRPRRFPHPPRDQVDDQPNQVKKEDDHYPEPRIHPSTRGIPVYPHEKRDPNEESHGNQQLGQPQSPQNRFDHHGKD